MFDSLEIILSPFLLILVVSEMQICRLANLYYCNFFVLIWPNSPIQLLCIGYTGRKRAWGEEMG